MDLTVIIATFGEDSWRHLARERAFPSAQVEADEVLLVHGETLAEARNALRDHDRVFASLPVRTLLAADGPIRALQDEGYMLIPPGDEVAVGHREQDGAPPRRVEGQGEHR